jgi:hypothetical protein
MQHVLGTPSLFLTVTFDDENSLLMQVMSGDLIDDDSNIADLSESDLAKRALKRKELRLNHPGLGALSFEMLLEVVSEQVIGWNMREHCATDRIGLFGKCEGVAAAMEEQGRRTVHVHFSIWIKGFAELRNQLFFGTQEEKRSAADLLPDYCEHISSTELIGSGSHRKNTVVRAFDHENCTTPLREREVPRVVDDQGLRNLRHRLAYKENSKFAWCEHCMQGYTNEDLVGLYCLRIGHIGQSPVTVERSTQGTISVPKSRMHALCIEFQKNRGASASDVPSLSINATYNSHASSHVTGCFKCQKKRKRNHQCGTSQECECRYRMPDRPRKKACVRYVKQSNPWFAWNGTEKDQPIIEILPKRQDYDLFQNVSCKAISESKLTCNSNVSVITDGPVGQYQFKYILKSTQADDTAPYALVEYSIKSLAGRVHNDDKKEASRRICRAAFAHSKGNVIGPAMASFLTRHSSRFYFSHHFQYCPVRDLGKALNNGTLHGKSV